MPAKRWLRRAFRPEIQRWRRQILGTSEALKDERRAIEAEQRDPGQTARADPGPTPAISRHGFSPVARADDQFDVMNYNHRLRALHERITSYNARVSALRQSLSEHAAHLEHSGLTRASREP